MFVFGIVFVCITVCFVLPVLYLFVCLFVCLLICLFICLFVLLLFVLLIDYPGHLPLPWFVAGSTVLDLRKVKKESIHLSLQTLRKYRYWNAASTQDLIFGNGS